MTESRSSVVIGYLSLDDDALLRQCCVDPYRASGPGGQKRNKTDSAVRLRHRPTGLVTVGVESRSQHENKARALRRLRGLIALSVRTPLRIDDFKPGEQLGTCVSQAGKLVVGRRDRRYHHAVSEVLDLLLACEMRVSVAAEHLGVSTANLVGFFHKDPALWGAVNRMRRDAGLKTLR